MRLSMSKERCANLLFTPRPLSSTQTATPLTSTPCPSPCPCPCPIICTPLSLLSALSTPLAPPSRASLASWIYSSCLLFIFALGIGTFFLTFGTCTDSTMPVRIPAPSLPASSPPLPIPEPLPPSLLFPPLLLTPAFPFPALFLFLTVFLTHTKNQTHMPNAAKTRILPITMPATMDSWEGMVVGCLPRLGEGRAEWLSVWNGRGGVGDVDVDVVVGCVGEDGDVVVVECVNHEDMDVVVEMGEIGVELNERLVVRLLESAVVLIDSTVRLADPETPDSSVELVEIKIKFRIDELSIVTVSPVHGKIPITYYQQPWPSTLPLWQTPTPYWMSACHLRSSLTRSSCSSDPC
ncbi:hypothetical protein BDV96DRAFT_329348 [Lophiotrema nucula]|uniref:Uncharacterized protein n=1 Tax=Lophiotrema nucula TaxID=690887 RepID=A0A6A5YIB3_9PLEO|nr:hypothetical protein BDV96DRAFT_329348 [Lophiotrema nucula]